MGLKTKFSDEKLGELNTIFGLEKRKKVKKMYSDYTESFKIVQEQIKLLNKIPHRFLVHK